MSERGDLEYREHVRTWRGFTRLLGAGVAVAVIALILMAMTLV